MAILRFKTIIDNSNNNLDAFLAVRDGENFPSKTQPGSRYNFGNAKLSTWTVSLAPAGKIENETIICEVERSEEEN